MQSIKNFIYFINIQEKRSNIKHQPINLHINTMNRLTQNYTTTKQPDVIPQEKISPSLKTLHNS